MSPQDRAVQQAIHQSAWRRWALAGGGALLAALASGACGGAAPPPLLQGVVAIATGGSHACALLADDTVRCWGSDGQGELGDGERSPYESAPKVITPKPVTGLTGIAQVVGGGQHTCARSKDATVKCWGTDLDGVLLRVAKGGFAATPQPMPGLSDIAVVRARGDAKNAFEDGAQYTCGVTTSGAIKCWGDTEFRQHLLGWPIEMALIPDDTPTEVPGLTGAVDVALGGSHACSLMEDGSVQCWGLEGGPFGLTVPIPSTVFTPAVVPGLTAVKQVVGGRMHGCALLSDGTVRCWGQNCNGQLGNGEKQCNSVGPTPPIAVPDLNSVTALAAGTDHTCSLLADTTVQCWGDDAAGQMGRGSPRSDRAFPPGAVLGLRGVRSISAGGRFTCALLVEGTVKCWGDNTEGQLGGGKPSVELVAAPVTVVSGS
jgi:alpha-tubulin suppressor-like RCC1 family protein